MAKTVNFTAERINEDETTIILFKCKVSSQFASIQEVKTAISNAVKVWIQETAEGKKILEDNNGDFNFGDLALFGQRLACVLSVFLDRFGIYELETETISGLESFSLDENLSQ